MITRRLIAFLLMLTLPLQGIAAAFMPVLMARLASDGAAALPCHAQMAEAHGGNTHNSTSPSADHSSHHQATPGAETSAPAHHAPTDSDSRPHACCHPVFSCAPGCVPAAPAQRFGDVPRAALTLATLYIPDSPDRPPRG